MLRALHDLALQSSFVEWTARMGTGCSSGVVGRVGVQQNHWYKDLYVALHDLSR